jgi:hypothetical protein
MIMQKWCGDFGLRGHSRKQRRWLWVLIAAVIVALVLLKFILLK